MHDNLLHIDGCYLTIQTGVDEKAEWQKLILLILLAVTNVNVACGVFVVFILN